MLPGYDGSAGTDSRPSGYAYPQPAPLSKYHRTPTPSQAWGSSGLQHGGPTMELQSRTANPPLPPRPRTVPSPGPSAPPRDQWPSGPAGTGYLGHLPGSTPSAPPADHVTTPSYDPRTYGPMPGSLSSPIGLLTTHTAGSSVQSDTSRWGGKYNQGQADDVFQGSNPPLPPRPYSATQQGQGPYQAPATVKSPSLEPSVSYPNATVLHTASYNPHASPVLDFHEFSSKENTTHMPSNLDYSNRPPPPPPKLPQDHREGQRTTPQHPLYPTQPQNHHYGPEIHMSNGLFAQSAQRPGNDYSNSPAWQASPLPPSNDATSDRFTIGHQLHKESISPEGFEDGDQISFPSKQGQSRPPFVSPPNSTHATLVHQYPYRNSASPELSTAFPAETGVSEPRTHTVDHRTANPAFEKASNSPLNDSVELRHESYGTTLAPTVLGDHLSQAVSNYTASSALNNASALGIGGPSDWEYFGDYATEEVDDTELYSTLRPQASNIPVLETAELPAEPFPTTEGHQQHAMNSIVTDTKQPHASNPSPGGGISRKQSTQSFKTSQRTEHQLRQPTPPLHPEASMLAITDDLIEGEGSLPDLSHSTQSNQALQSSTESPVHYVEVNGLNSHDSSSAQNIKLDDKELDNSRAHKFDREAPVLLVGTQMPSNLPGSQSQSDEKALHSEVNPPIHKSHTPPPLYHRQLDSSDPKIAKPHKHTPSASEDVADPYADLDAWAKASLNRYVTMLRQEAQATTNEEKHRIFVTFTNRESRLRAVLYEAEMDEWRHDPGLSSIAFVTDVAKPRPASVLAEEQSLQPVVNQVDTSPEVDDSHVQSGAPPSDRKSTDSVPTTEHHAMEGSYTTIESPDNIQYSPGGRPIVTRHVNSVIHHNVRLAAAPRQKTPKIDPVQVAPPNTNEAHSPGSDAPMVVESDTTDREKQLESPESISMRPSGYPGIQRYVSPPPNAPDRPVYAPFRDKGEVSESADRSTDHQSMYRPCSTQRLDSLDSGIDNTQPLETSRRGTLNTPLGMETEPGEMLNDTTISDAVPDILGVGPRKTSLDLVPQSKTLNSNVSALASLETVLPEHSIPNPDPTPLHNLKQAANAVVDDFSFIRKTVITWDTKAKQLRERHDKARHSRQVESEERINGLFDEQQIGYGDISVLEAEIKRSEAIKKADEDRSEYETFSTDIFEVVWTRLHEDIYQLTPLYGSCTQMLNDALAGKDMFEGFDSRPALGPVMELSLALHQRLETRYQKAFEAVLERNRRLKKIQVAPLYALGSVTEVKKLEKQFEDAERGAILDHCQKRAKRAYGLMEVLYQNTQRGVGANQDYMEAIMQAVKRIVDDAASAPSRRLDDPGALQTIVKAESVVTALAHSSEQVVQMFHVADKLLSAADYEVSVAEARLGHADAAVLKQRNEEKAKEDLKLVRDLEHRLALIRQGFKRTKDELAKVFAIAGDKQTDKATPEETSRPSIESSDPVHEARIQKALEEAKRRNALRDPALNHNAY